MRLAATLPAPRTRWLFLRIKLSKNGTQLRVLLKNQA
jgi:hypothetical protein